MLRRLEELRKRYTRQVSTVLGITIVLAYILHSIIPNTLSFEVATGFSLSLIFVYLSIILANLERLPNVQITSNYSDSNKVLQNYINNAKIKRVEIIAYNLRDVLRGILRQILNENASVVLLIQHPDHAIDKSSKKTILETIIFLRDLSAESSRLEVFLYRSHPTYRSVVIDDKFIMLSSYDYIIEGEKIHWLNYPHILLTDSSSDFEKCKLAIDFAFSQMSSRSQKLGEYLQQNPEI